MSNAIPLGMLRAVALAAASVAVGTSAMVAPLDLGKGGWSESVPDWGALDFGNSAPDWAEPGQPPGGPVMSPDQVAQAAQDMVEQLRSDGLLGAFVMLTADPLCRWPDLCLVNPVNPPVFPSPRR